MRLNWCLRSWFILLVLTIPAYLIQAQIQMDVPPWDGAVSSEYKFTTDSKTPVPESYVSSFGIPVALIEPGSFSAGWQRSDPEQPVIPSYGSTGSGAWDLGASGTIKVLLPLGDLAGSEDFKAYRVRLQVNCTAYGKMYGMPQLTVERYGLQCLDYTTEFAYNDLCLGSWSNCTWSANLISVRENTITLILSGNQYWGSVVDMLEISVVAEEMAEVTHTGMGVPITWYESYGLLPATGDEWNDLDFYDTDEDGILNWQEYMAGSDPKTSDSGLHITNIKVLSDCVPLLQWQGSRGGSQSPYVIEGTRELRRPEWEILGHSERQDGLNEWVGSGIEPLVYRFFRIKGENDRLCPVP